MIIADFRTAESDFDDTTLIAHVTRDFDAVLFSCTDADNDSLVITYAAVRADNLALIDMTSESDSDDDIAVYYTDTQSSVLFALDDIDTLDADLTIRIRAALS